MIGYLAGEPSCWLFPALSHLCTETFIPSCKMPDSLILNFCGCLVVNYEHTDRHGKAVVLHICAIYNCECGYK